MMDMATDNKGTGVKELHHVSAKEAIQLISNGAILVDVRPEYELGRQFDVEEIIYCPHKEIHEHLPELPKNRTLIIADAVGLRSNEVCRLLLNNGFQEIYNLAGGIVDWDRAGCPVTADKSRILTGSCMCQLKIRSKKTK